MCGRYHVGSELMDELNEMADVTDGVKAGSELSLSGKDIHPGDLAPVLTGREGTLVCSRQLWGFTGPGGKGLIFNARSETVFEKKMFSDSIRNRRAAVPVSWFYEWNKSKEKYTFARKEGGVMYLAGFTRRYQGGEHFVILTTEANQSMESVHSRMPLVLEKAQVGNWILSAQYTEKILAQIPTELARTCDYEQMTIPL